MLITMRDDKEDLHVNEMSDLIEAGFETRAGQQIPRARFAFEAARALFKTACLDAFEALNKAHGLKPGCWALRIRREMEAKERTTIDELEGELAEARKRLAHILEVAAGRPVDAEEVVVADKAGC